MTRATSTRMVVTLAERRMLEDYRALPNRALRANCRRWVRAWSWTFRRLESRKARHASQGGAR